jgi:pilus assembly protein CpaE
MANSPTAPKDAKAAEWPWRVGLVAEDGPLADEITQLLAAAGATKVFTFRPAVSPFEVANAVERQRPEIVFVELAKTSKTPAEWVADVRRDDDPPLIVAVHSVPDPAEMIRALRAGASEFLCPPLQPAISEAMDRIGTLLEAKHAKLTERGKTLGFLSAKGGCGATTIAGHLTAALQTAQPGVRVLLADVDVQAPGGHLVLRREPKRYLPDALEAVRRLTTNSWREFVTPGGPNVDILAASPDPRAAVPEQWRVESLFRFMSRHYNFVLADLGRHLNPSNWSYLPHMDEVVVVTAPDVLALYQTRSILQTLANRGFDKSRIRIVLNRNLTSPQDFWVESIEQMFEISVFGVIPNDYFTLEKLPADRFEFPAGTPFGTAMVKLAMRITKQNGAGPAKKAA